MRSYLHQNTTKKWPYFVYNLNNLFQKTLNLSIIWRKNNPLHKILATKLDVMPIFLPFFPSFFLFSFHSFFLFFFFSESVPPLCLPFGGKRWCVPLFPLATGLCTLKSILSGQFTSRVHWPQLHSLWGFTVQILPDISKPFPD